MPSFGRFRTQRSVQWTLRLAQDLAERKTAPRPGGELAK